MAKRINPIHPGEVLTQTISVVCCGWESRAPAAFGDLGNAPSTATRQNGSGLMGLDSP